MLTTRLLSNNITYIEMSLIGQCVKISSTAFKYLMNFITFANRT